MGCSSSIPRDHPPLPSAPSRSNAWATNDVEQFVTRAAGRATVWIEPRPTLPRRRRPGRATEVLLQLEVPPSIHRCLKRNTNHGGQGPVGVQKNHLPPEASKLGAIKPVELQVVLI